MLRIALLLSILFCSLLPLSAYADLQNSRTELEAIRQRIDNIQNDLTEKRQSETELTRELALLNGTLKKIDRRIGQLRKEQQQLDRKMQKQQKKIAAGERSLRQVARRVEKRLVALYKEGEVGPLRILFSTESPTELVQQYQYLTRVLEADKELIGEYREALLEQEKELQALQQFKNEKQQLLDAEQQQRRYAAEGKKLQAKVLRQVRTEQGRIKQELTDLQEKAGRLKALVNKLEAAPEPPPEAMPLPSGGIDFKTGKGQLPWPVGGEVLIGFGTQKDANLGTIYESNGIEVAAPSGQSMRAVANGRVVFADWFKGYGNLMILSHPGGYHSLYAQAARLERAIGEVVQAGDTVGVSGLSGRDSIYFEIRYNGTPLNPLQWLKRRK